MSAPRFPVPIYLSQSSEGMCICIRTQSLRKVYIARELMRHLSAHVFERLFRSRQFISPRLLVELDDGVCIAARRELRRIESPTFRRESIFVSGDTRKWV